MTRQIQIGIGVEIECGVNSKIHSIETGSYNGNSNFNAHRHKTLIPGMIGWEAQDDGSLSSNFGNPKEYDTYSAWKNWENWVEPIEIISKCYTSKLTFFNGLKAFKKKISKNGLLPLNRVLVFNDSMGAHVHFSIKNFKFGDKTIFDIYPEVREFFKNKLLSSNISSKNQIWKHYNRSYARPLDNYYFRNRDSDRRLEFNFVSERQNKGIEWRSPNMLNIQTWDEFFEYWNIIWDTLMFFANKARKWQKDWDENMFSEDVFEKIQMLTKIKRQEINENYQNKFDESESLEIFKPGRDKTKYYYVGIEDKSWLENVVSEEINIDINQGDE